MRGRASAAASRWSTTVDGIGRVRRGRRRRGAERPRRGRHASRARDGACWSSKRRPSRAEAPAPRSSRCPATCTTCARRSIRSRSASRAFRELPLAEHGLEWVHPDVPLAHPLDGGRVALLHRSVDETAAGLGADADAYRHLMTPFVRQDLVDGLLDPISFPARRYRSPGSGSSASAPPSGWPSTASRPTRPARSSPACPRTPCCRCGPPRPPGTAC